MFKFKRSTEDKVVAGICGGLAKKYNFNSTIIRILCFLAIAFSNGVGLILYFIISFLTESDNKRSDIDFDDETVDDKIDFTENDK